MWAYRACLAVSVVFAVTAIVRADEEDDREALIKRVKPSVVRVKIDAASGADAWSTPRWD